MGSSAATCGIHFPKEGSELGPLHWKLGVLDAGPPGYSSMIWFSFRKHCAVRILHGKQTHIIDQVWTFLLGTGWKKDLHISPFGFPSSIPWRRQWHPTPAHLPGNSHGRRSLVGCSPRGQEESDTAEWLHVHFSFSCTGEGNGNPLQCSCLENPRDGGAWWAAVYGVAQSRTRLKWLNSSRGSSYHA